MSDKLCNRYGQTRLSPAWRPAGDLATAALYKRIRELEREVERLRDLLARERRAGIPAGNRGAGADDDG